MKEKKNLHPLNFHPSAFILHPCLSGLSPCPSVTLASNYICSPSVFDFRVPRVLNLKDSMRAGGSISFYGGSTKYKTTWRARSLRISKALPSDGGEFWRAR